MFNQVIVVFLIFFLNGGWCAVRWEDVRCATDPQQAVPEGKVPDIGRFPWLGVIQHTFCNTPFFMNDGTVYALRLRIYLGGKTRFAVTNGILVHPSYVIASAEDVSRIQPQGMDNNTKFIVWKSETAKFSMEVDSYFLPPEYTDGLTLASLALLHISDTYGEESSRAPVPPICLPFKGAGLFQDLYAVKMTDETGELEKEMYKMRHVENPDCDKFYSTHKLNHKTMSPVKPFCAASVSLKEVCVWDSGAALISRQNWGYWKLIGFSVRGPGCGAPTRFLYLHDYLLWIDEVISQAPLGPGEEDTVLMFRRLSPIKLIMYSPKIRQPKEIGNCERGRRGGIMYKDSTELLISKNIVQGFFFLSVAQVAQMNCALVVLDVNARTNAAVWVEHHCHPDLRGDRRGKVFRDHRQKDCFMYFKSVAYVEFRFYFSFKASLEVALYGHEETPRIIPNPFRMASATHPWQPTFSELQEWNFVPLTSWWWSM